MGIRRIDPVTVVDEETGQQFYFPDLPEEERLAPSVTRPTSGGLERYVERAAPEIEMPPETVGGPSPEVSIGEAVLEEPPVSVGEAQIESVGPLPDRTMPMTGRLPPGVGAGSGPFTGTPMSPEEVVRRVEAATPPPRAAAAPGGESGQPLDPYSAPSAPTAVGAGALDPLDPYAAPAAPGKRARANVPGSLDELAGNYADSAARTREAAGVAARVKQEAARREADYERDRAFLEEQHAIAAEKEMAAAEKATRDRWDAWKAKYDEAANSEVNPERYWNSRTEFQKAAWMIGMMAHGWMNPKGRNLAVEQFNQAIDRDIAAQESNRKYKLDHVRGEKDYLGQLDAQDQNALENRATARGLRIKALERSLQARIKALGPAAEAADYEGVLAKLQEDEVKVGAELYTAQQNEENQKAQLRIERARLAIARRAAAAKQEKAAKPPEYTGPNLDARLGLTTVDANGNVIPGGFALEKSHEQAGKVAQAAASGNKENAALLGLKRALADQSLMDKLRSSNQEVRENAIKMAYARARQLGGPGVLTDQDVDTAMQTVTGQKGLSAWSYLITPGDPSALVDKGIKTLKRRVTNEIVGTGAIDVSRGRIEWNPQPLEDEDAGPRTPEDVRTEAAGAIGGDTGVKPLRRLPLGDLPEPARSAVYATEKKEGKLPKLPRTDMDEQTEALIASVSNPTTPLAEVDAVIRQVETSRLDSERKARALLELRAVRAAAAAHATEQMHRKELLRRGTAK